jgi:hypothetical protein
VRWQRGVKRQRSYLFIPDDIRLRSHAFQIGDQRRHSLRRRRDDDGEDDGFHRDPAELDSVGADNDDPAEQMSLFEALSATATERVHQAPEPLQHIGDDEPDAYDAPDDHHLIVELPPPPPIAGLTLGPLDARTRREERRRLRNANSEVGRLVVAKTGWTHARVNAELNRNSGIVKISEATLDQLERRLRYAERWLRDFRA